MGNPEAGNLPGSRHAWFVAANAGVMCRQPPLRRGMGMDIVLDSRPEGKWMVVDVKGEVDVYTAPKLREKIVDLVTQGSHEIIVNLEGVEFLDSTGLGVLVGGLKRVKSHDGTMALVCTKPKILKVFSITGLSKVFPIFDTVQEAVAQ
jgi:anti-sigma B factor antagonist